MKWKLIDTDFTLATSDPYRCIFGFLFTTSKALIGCINNLRMLVASYNFDVLTLDGVNEERGYESWH